MNDKNYKRMCNSIIKLVIDGDLKEEDVNLLEVHGVPREAIKLFWSSKEYKFAKLLK